MVHYHNQLGLDLVFVHCLLKFQPNSIEAVLTPNMSFKEVLNQLLVLVASPIRQKLSGGDDYCSGSHLVTNACHFLAAIIGELAATSVGMEV